MKLELLVIVDNEATVNIGSEFCTYRPSRSGR